MTPQELLRLMGDRQSSPPSAPTPEAIARFLALSAGLAAPRTPNPLVHATPQYAPPGTTPVGGDLALHLPLGTTGYGYREGPSEFHYDVQERGVEAPHPLLDPVDLAAGALTPAGLRAFRALGQKLDDPLTLAALRSGRQGVLRNQRGNLGPPPVDAQGRPLPKSVVRERLYHGTNRSFDDFSVDEFGTGAGGDLYGPGVYMTSDPAVAGGGGQHGVAYGYATGRLPENAVKDAQRVLAKYPTPRDLRTAIKDGTFVLPESLDNVLWGDQTLKEVVAGGIPPQYAQEFQGVLGEIVAGRAASGTPNVRPVYVDMQRPFIIDEAVPVALQEQMSREFAVPRTILQTGQDAYRQLVTHLGSKAQANAWLQAQGYDGITHIGGGAPSPHRVFVAFSPDSVYPAPNVESLLQLLRTKEP